MILIKWWIKNSLNCFNQKMNLVFDISKAVAIVVAISLVIIKGAELFAPHVK